MDGLVSFAMAVVDVAGGSFEVPFAGCLESPALLDPAVPGEGFWGGIGEGLVSLALVELEIAGGKFEITLLEDLESLALLGLEITEGVIMEGLKFSFLGKLKVGGGRSEVEGFGIRTFS